MGPNFLIQPNPSPKPSDVQKSWTQPDPTMDGDGPCDCSGHIPSNILVGGRQWEYSHQYYYVRSGIADQY